MRAQSLFWARDGAGLAVIGAVETALWDIRGKACGLPVYELLGGRVHDRLMIYASAGLNRPLDATLEEMRRYRALGYRAVKVRVGFGLRADVEKIGSIRETIGAEMDLMVDAVQGHHPEPWTASEAIEVGRALEPFRIRWFEEPCGATDYAGYARVRDHVAIPIAGGESTVSVAGFKRFLEHGSLDIVQPDTAHAGGILECQRIATLAEAYGAGIAFHCWASSAMLAPNVHLAFATPACEVVEYPTWGYPLIHDLFAEPLRIEDGYLNPPTGPGLGIRLTDEIRHKYPYRGGIGAVMKSFREA
jgi:L-alanine-DL-glutamate epimerase-like enolase superfamily enzyme